MIAENAKKLRKKNRNITTDPPDIDARSWSCRLKSCLWALRERRGGLIAGGLREAIDRVAKDAVAVDTVSVDEADFNFPNGSSSSINLMLVDGRGGLELGVGEGGRDARLATPIPLLSLSLMRDMFPVCVVSSFSSNESCWASWLASSLPCSSFVSSALRFCELYARFFMMNEYIYLPVDEDVLEDCSDPIINLFTGIRVIRT